MKYFYLGLLDLYLPAVAAAIHFGRMEDKTPPSQAKLETIKYFRRGYKEEDGRLFFAGTDSAGDNVYLLCVKVQPEVVARSVESLLGLYHLPVREIKVVPCLPENPQLVGWGRILSWCGLHRLEKDLACRMVRNCFRSLAQAVAEAKLIKQF